MTARAMPETLADRASKPGASPLRLYVAPGTPNSTRAEQNLRAALDQLERLDPILQLEVVDVSAHVKLALSDGVIVTPTLIGRRGDERFTILGDLSDGPKLRLFLGTFCEI